MENNWLDRLREAIEKDGRSLNQLSIDAGLGRNYVQQMIKDGKKPGAEKLASILDALGQEVSFYVLTGLKFNPSDLELLRIVSSIDGASKEHARALLERLRDTPDAPKQSLSYEPEDPSKLERSE